jgi:hypothetical protein
MRIVAQVGYPEFTLSGAAPRPQTRGSTDVACLNAEVIERVRLGELQFKKAVRRPYKLAVNRMPGEKQNSEL